MASPRRLLLVLPLLLILGAAAWVPLSPTGSPVASEIAPPLQDPGEEIQYENAYSKKHNRHFVKVHVSDAKGVVYEVTLNSVVVEAVISAPVSKDQEILKFRVNRIFNDITAFDSAQKGPLLDYLRTATVEVREWIPNSLEWITDEFWYENLFLDPDSVHQVLDFGPTDEEGRMRWIGMDSVWAEFEFGEGEEARVISGYFVNHHIPAIQQIYVLSGHNPVEDECIKLSNCRLFCDGGKER